MTEQAIDRCLFCHSDKVNLCNKVGYTFCWVECFGCGAKGPDGATEHDAIYGWNDAPRKPILSVVKAGK